MYRALLLSSSLLIVMSSPQFHTHHGRRVCQRDVRHNVVMVTESYVQPVHKPYITVCQGHRLCSTYKTTYSLAYRQVSRTVSTSHSVPECCPGWRRLHSTNCNQAVCRHLCINGGTCQRPNLCACPPGWTGDRCQTDVDECSGKHPCVQRCVNTAGSYRCACGDGFRLAADGQSCQTLPIPPPDIPTQDKETRGGDQRDAGGDADADQKCKHRVAAFQTLFFVPHSVLGWGLCSHSSFVNLVCWGSTPPPPPPPPVFPRFSRLPFSPHLGEIHLSAEVRPQALPGHFLLTTGGTSVLLVYFWCPLFSPSVTYIASADGSSEMLLERAS
uniref:EGF-like-domain, multiple 7 n=1 Tax=Oryzias sinensis TaxID=183150 RepID=A0A8C7XAN5_9TELE